MMFFSLASGLQYVTLRIVSERHFLKLSLSCTEKNQKILCHVLRSYIHPKIANFPACSVRDNPRQARFPLNYCRRRIRLKWRESTPPFRGSSFAKAQTVCLVCQFIWCDEQERRNRQDRPDRHPQVPAGKARSQIGRAHV